MVNYNHRCFKSLSLDRGKSYVYQFLCLKVGILANVTIPQEGRIAAALDISYDDVYHDINKPEGFVHSAFQILRMPAGSFLTLAPVCSTWVFMNLDGNTKSMLLNFPPFFRIVVPGSRNFPSVSHSIPLLGFLRRNRSGAEAPQEEPHTNRWAGSQCPVWRAGTKWWQGLQFYCS